MVHLALVFALYAATAAPLRPRTLIVPTQLVQKPDAQRIAEAERALGRHDAAQAFEILEGLASPAAQLMRARVALGAGDTLTARVSLAGALQAAELAPYTQLECGRLSLADGEQADAVLALEPLWRSGGPLGQQAALPLAAAWAIANPQALIDNAEALLGDARRTDRHARGRLLGWLAVAQQRRGRNDDAFATLMRRFVEEAASSETPSEPPPGPAPSATLLLGRLERLVEGHRNQQAQAALALLDRFVPPEQLPAPLRCRRAYIGGLLARKLHQYRHSELLLGEVLERCPPGELTQKAAFVQAKVISIQDGLRALAPIERFVAAYPHGSMVDDVLLWAGDALQRRGRATDAAAYYARILALKEPDDQCGEAAFRLAWLAHEQHDPKAAKRALTELFEHKCPLERGEQARMLLWLSRFAEAANEAPKSRAYAQELRRLAPMSFYGQVGFAEQLRSAPPKARAQLVSKSRALARSKAGVRALCAGTLAQEPAFGRALTLLEHGLMLDASRELISLVGKLPHDTNVSLERCGPAQSALLLALLLGRADAPRQAQQLLARHFAGALGAPPTPATLPIWRAAYPLAFEQDVQRAERESKLPRLLLQALAREESSFDPHVVSWAEAYGLTQLLVASAQQAARSLPEGPRTVGPEQLENPQLNLRLGAALLRLYLDRVGDSVALGLAAYNGGLEHARGYAERFAGTELVTFVEQIGIRETRMYVRRVLETWGIYRWLYEGQPPALPTLGRLPAAAGAAPKANPQARGKTKPKAKVTPRAAGAKQKPARAPRPKS